LLFLDAARCPTLLDASLNFLIAQRWMKNAFTFGAQ
jgi:hypothetical protein